MAAQRKYPEELRERAVNLLHADRHRTRRGMTVRSDGRHDRRARVTVNVADGSYAAGIANFAVRLVHGPCWDSSRPIRDQEGWTGHATFMDELVEDDFVILGGPVGGGEQTLHAVEATNENEIRARLAADPWVVAGLLRIGTIESWALWLDSRQEKRPR